MSVETSTKILKEIRETTRAMAITACWRQWEALGGSAATTTPRPTAIIDPEALVLLSLAIKSYERRLEDMLAWWADVGGTLMSVQRFITLSTQFPDDVRERIGSFATYAVDAGDKRWRRYTANGSSASNGRRQKGSDKPTLLDASALMMRLRAGFGVGAKADVLSFLLGINSTAATVQDISRATGYTAPAIRTAVRDMALARFIRTTPGSPVRYLVYSPHWHTLLDPESDALTPPPPWRFWPEIFAFLCHVDNWANTTATQNKSPYALSSEARDLFYAWEPVFVLNRIQVPQPEMYTGVLYLEAFQETIIAVSEWLEMNL